jgi:hypothetical protein
MTPRQAETFLRRRARAMEANAMAAERQTMAFALQEARRLSGGPFKTAMLRAMGHPYAKRRPRPPIDAAIINKQSNVFRRSWRVVPPRQAGKEMVSTLSNIAPYARFLFEGTRLMIMRPTLLKIRKRVAAFRHKQYRSLLKKSFKS